MDEFFADLAKVWAAEIKVFVGGAMEAPVRQFGMEFAKKNGHKLDIVSDTTGALQKRLKAGEKPMTKKVRFRTLGCYPLSGAIESEADTLQAIIQEMLLTSTSERQGRLIDHDGAASMEKKKQEGYF